MTTTLQIVTRAYRKNGIAANDTALTADEIAEGVDALNAMIYAWKLRGVDVSHVALAAPDTFALGSEYEEGTVYLLASRLAPNYEIPPAFDAEAWFRNIQASYWTQDASTFQLGLTRMPSQRYRYVADDA